MEPSELFGRILVGVDTAGLATNAVVRGINLADRLGAELTLLHAVDLPPSLWPGIHEDKLADIHAARLATERAKVIDALEPALREAGFQELPARDTLMVSPGHPAEALTRKAEELDAELIIIGGHARRGLFDFGSTARAVLARGQTPIWTQVDPVSPIRRILVAVDFSAHGRRALDCAHALATRLEASLRVLHCHSPTPFVLMDPGGAVPDTTLMLEEVRDTARAELDRLMDEYEWRTVRARPVFLVGDAAENITEQAEGVDLVVMGTQGRTALSRFLLGSVAYSVLKNAPGPVLVVPEPRGE